MPGLGEEFRAAREARHLSLADVSEQIHIRSVYLQSIEEEDWTAIAAPVYVRGFIRTYARFLGLDPESAVEAYNADLDAVEREAGGPVRVAPARRRGPSIWILIAGSAAVILLCFVAYSYYQLQTSGSATAPAAEDLGSAAPLAAESASPGVQETASAEAALAGSPTPESSIEATATSREASPTPSAAPSPSPAPTLSPSPKPTKPAGPAAGGPEPSDHPRDLVTTPSPVPSAALSADSLEVVITDRAWVRVNVDGRRRMEGIYPPGTRMSFSGHSAYVRTGNAGGVVLVVDGRNLGKMGPGGAVVEHTYTLSEE